MTTDIRVGDLIRATHKKYAESVSQGRVTYVWGSLVETEPGDEFDDDTHHIEVLDRPVPKVEDDLLDKVIALYRKAAGWEVADFPQSLRAVYARNLTPVINAVREYDRSKESK